MTRKSSSHKLHKFKSLVWESRQVFQQLPQLCTWPLDALDVRLQRNDEEVNASSTDSCVASGTNHLLTIIHICNYIRVYAIYIYMERKMDQIDRQIGRQVGRQIDRQIGRQIDRQVDRQVGRQIGRQIGRRVHRQVDRQIDT